MVHRQIGEALAIEGDAGMKDAGPIIIPYVDAGKPDAGKPDAGKPDAGFDAGVDAGKPDAGVDAGFDAGFDAGVDAGVDGGFDASSPARIFREHRHRPGEAALDRRRRQRGSRADQGGGSAGPPAFTRR